MPEPVTIGQKGAFIQPVQFGRDDSGTFQRYTYEGDTNSILRAAYSFDLAGWVYTFTELHGGRSRLEARAGWGNFKQNYDSNADVENIWELEQQDDTKALLQSDFPFGVLNFQSSQSAIALQKVIDNTYVFSDFVADTAPGAILPFNTGDITLVSYIFDSGGLGTNPTDIHLPSGDYAICKSLYALIQRGVDSFPIEASIIRHSQLVSNIYAVQASFFNINRLISTASMYSVEQTPDGLLFAVPSTPTPAQFIETPGDLQYGWRKVRPNVSRLAAYKWRIQQNYQLGLWPIRLYGGVL